jgi:glycosyltransferase involved in cell wall biosynthesis
MAYRLGIVASHVIQYQDPFFRLLAADPELDVEVLYCSRAGAEVYRDEDMKTSLQWDLELLQGYRHRFLRNLAHGGGGFGRLVNPGLVRAIARGGYDAVLFMTGWGAVSAWIGVLSALLFRVPILMFGDSSFVPEEKTGRGRLRAGVMRALFGMTSAFMISGSWNADYYRHYGADPRRFFPMPWAIDNRRFTEASRLSAGERAALRAKLGIAEDKMVIAYSGKLIVRKDPLTLVQAFERMRHRDRAALLFIGDGELRGAIESYVARRSLADVVIAGFVNQTEIPRLYAASDAFVLPSSFDPRATVVNEAMACGLPVLITDRCGPAGDIVRQGDNGFIFPYGDADALALHLDTLAADPALRARMAARSREIISDWSYETGVDGIKQALRFISTGGAA